MSSILIEHYGNFILLLLIIIRISIIFALLPIFDWFNVQNNIKIMLVLFLSIIVYSQIETQYLIITTVQLFEYIAFDVISAFIIGFTITLVIHSYKMIGEMLSYSSGLSMSTFYDPSGGISHVYTPFLKVLFLAAIISINGHYILITGIIESFKFLPLGTTLNIVETEGMFQIIKQFSYVFSIVVFSTLPFVFLAVASDVFFGYATKSMPAFNIFAIGIQFKILLILLMFYFSLNFVFELFVECLKDLDWLLTYE